MTTAEGAPGSVDPFVFSERAQPQALVIAVAIDVLVVAGIIATGLVALTRGAVLGGLALLVLAAAVVGALLAVLALLGRSIGAVVCGIRIVERSSGTPSGDRLLVDLFGSRLVAYDIRRGRDPITAAVAPFQFPERASAALSPERASRNAVALLDSGQRVPFARALVIGRNPTTDARGDQRFSWPDLSRTLSKTHLRLEWDGEQVWATDLGSANGSALQTGDELVALDAFVPARMPADAVLWAGDRSITIAGSRRERARHPAPAVVVAGGAHA